MQIYFNFFRLPCAQHVYQIHLTAHHRYGTYNYDLKEPFLTGTPRYTCKMYWTMYVHSPQGTQGLHEHYQSYAEQHLMS